MVILLVLICLLFGANNADAEWQKSADLGLNFNQAGYNDAWAGGESGSVTWVVLGNLTAERSFEARYNWRNTLKLSFGQTHSQAEGDDGKMHWLSPEKSTDRIFVESLFRLTLGKFADPFAALTIESQFYDASVKQHNRPISPMTVSEAVGVGRLLVKKESTELLSRFGFSLRQHISRDIVSLEPEKTEINTTNDGGLEWVTDFSHKLNNLKYVSKLRFFKAVYNSESDELSDTEGADHWKSVDVAWENSMSVSVSKYIQVSMFCELLYDREIDLRGRFRETIGLGLTYKLF